MYLLVETSKSIFATKILPLKTVPYVINFPNSLLVLHFKFSHYEIRFFNCQTALEDTLKKLIIHSIKSFKPKRNKIKNYKFVIFNIMLTDRRRKKNQKIWKSKERREINNGRGVGTAVDRCEWNLYCPIC